MKNCSNAITIFAHFPRVFMSSITRWLTRTRPSQTRTCVCSSSIFICIFLAPDSPLNRPTPSISTINIISQQLQSSLNRGARNERMHDTSRSNSLLVILPSLFAHAHFSLSQFIDVCCFAGQGYLPNGHWTLRAMRWARAFSLRNPYVRSVRTYVQMARMPSEVRAF